MGKTRQFGTVGSNTKDKKAPKQAQPDDADTLPPARQTLDIGELPAQRRRPTSAPPEVSATLIPSGSASSPTSYSMQKRSRTSSSVLPVANPAAIEESIAEQIDRVQEPSNAPVQPQAPPSSSHGSSDSRSSDSKPMPSSNDHPQLSPPSVSSDSRATLIMEPYPGTGSRAPMQASQPSMVVELVEFLLTARDQLDPRLIVARHPESPRASMFRILRHRIRERGRPRVIAVTGATPTCGKTTTAANLAMAMGEASRGSVLLIDAHIKRPDLANLFKVVSPLCFLDQLDASRLSHKHTWRLLHLAAFNLHVATTMHQTQGGRRLHGPTFASAIEAFRLVNYDHIVIDCPPVLGSADLNLIQDSVDGVLLCGRTGFSRTREIERAVEQLSSEKILGTVLLE